MTGLYLRDIQFSYQVIHTDFIRCVWPTKSQRTFYWRTKTKYYIQINWSILQTSCKRNIYSFCRFRFKNSSIGNSDTNYWLSVCSSKPSTDSDFSQIQLTNFFGSEKSICGAFSLIYQSNSLFGFYRTATMIANSFVTGFAFGFGRKIFSLFDIIISGDFIIMQKHFKSNWSSLSLMKLFYGEELFLSRLILSQLCRNWRLRDFRKSQIIIISFFSFVLIQQ